MSPIVYLGMGSNLGNRAANLGAAEGSISAVTELMDSSSVYRTAPWGYSEQPDFYNQVLRVKTELSPTDLLARCKSIEESIGRQPTFRYGPRLIDIDILLYDELILDTPSLTIPHPRLVERAFMLIPLLEISADIIHPGSGKPLSQYLQGLDTSGVVRLTEAI